MNCPKCNYFMDAMDKECPRCAAMSPQRTVKLGDTPPASGAPTIALDDMASMTQPPVVVPPSTIFDSTLHTPDPFRTPPPPVANLGNEWYYIEAGRQCGPCTQTDVQDLIRTGVLQRHTKVWAPGMFDWQPAHLSRLSALFPRLDKTPPALPLEEPNDGLVWALAFTPLITGLILNVVSQGVQWDQETARLVSFFFPWVVNVALCIADDSQLHRAGYDMKGVSGFACFLVPVYLFLRAAKFKHSNGYAWMWVVCFLLTFAIPVHYYIPPEPVSDYPTY